MEKILKLILIWITVFTVCLGALFLGFMIWFNWGYYDELNQIRKELNSIDGARVISIGGHDDLELEEISARVQVKGKGIIVLNNLSKDAFQYPNHVDISEINGKSFEIFSCHNLAGIGIGGTLNIGTNGPLANEIDKIFKTPKDVIDCFKKIESIINNIPRYPKLKHYNNGKREEFIGIVDKSSEDKDPIFNLIGIEHKFEFAKALNWKNKKCYE